MPITTGIPTSIKRPGSFHSFLFGNAVAGLTPIAQAMACVGALTTAATQAADTPVQVYDGVDADTKFGAGSGVALMLRAAFRQVAQQGGIGPQIWGVGLTPPAGGTANVATGTLAGTATESGALTVRIHGVPITVGVTSGDTAATVATALEAQSDAQAAEMAVTAGVAGAVVTYTHRTKGEVGVDVDFETLQIPAGLTMTWVSNATPGVGVTDITAAVDALLAQEIHAVAIENRKSADVTDAKANTALAWGYSTKRYRHIVIGDPSTLATADTLAIAANDYTVIVVQCEGSPTLGGQLAAAFCARVWGNERPNANMDNAEIVGVPPADSAVYLSSELETALSAGTTPLVPNAAGDGLKIVRAVTTKTTTSSAADLAAFDVASSRTAAEVARQIDIAYLRDFTGPEAVMVIDDDDPEDVRTRVKDMIVGVHRALEAIRVLRNVDDYVGQIRVQESPSVPGRLDVDDPFRVVSPLHQAAFRHRAYL